MKFNRLTTVVTVVIFTLFSAQSIFAQRFMENLNRGLIAVKTSDGYFLSWRLSGTEPDNIGFNVYKGTTKLNPAVITNATCFQDNTSGSGIYTVKAVLGGVEQESSKAAIVLSTNYLNIPITPPATGYTQATLRWVILTATGNMR
jgi:rhamnogalacturonan endolyase